MKDTVRQSDLLPGATMPRLSPRYRVTGASLRWRPNAGSKLFPNRRSDQEAELVDLSVAGAQIRGPQHKAVKVGSRVKIELGGEEGVVEVRNVRDLGDGTCLYGVVFHHMSSRLEQAIHESIARLRDDERLRADWARR